MNKLIFLAGVFFLMGCSYGEVQVIDDSNVFISAPSVVRSSGWVSTTLISKLFTGDVDIAFGFNSSKARPSKSQLYQPHNVSWNTSHSAFFMNVSSISPTLRACIFGNEYNRYKRLIVYHVWESDSLSNSSFQVERETIVCFDSYFKTGLNYSISWNTQRSRVEDWRDISGIWSSIWYNYDGMDRWYYAKDIPVVAGREYVMRFWLDVEFTGLEENSGKFDIAIKRSDESIHEAIINNRFYLLDPWWNVSYSKAMEINCSLMTDGVPLAVNGSNKVCGQTIWSYCAGTGTKVYYNTLCGGSADYVVANDTTQLPMEIELGNGSDYLNTSVWTYFNINGAGSVWHFSESLGAVAKSSTSSGHVGSFAGDSNPSWIDIDTKFGYGVKFDGNDQRICTTETLAGWNEFTVMFWHNFTATGQDIFAMEGDASLTHTPWVGRFDTNYVSYLLDSTGDWTPAMFDAPVFPSGLTFYVESWDGTDYKNYVDGVLGDTVNWVRSEIEVNPSSSPCGALLMGCGYASGSDHYRETTGVMDEFRIFNRSLSIEIIGEIHNNSMNYAGFGDLGVEEFTPIIPSCSCTQFPIDLSFSHFGTNVSFDCDCFGEALNHSSFMWLHSLGENWSFRPPDTLMSDVERRGCNRYNKTLYPQYAFWYEYVSDLPQLTDNIYEWAVHDYQSAKVDLVDSGSNYSNYSTSILFDHLISSEWDLNRVFLQSEYKVNDFKLIYDNGLGAKKFTKGSTQVNVTYSCYINLESQSSTWFTSVYYCNESLVLLHEADPMSKDYCHFIDSFQDSDYTYSLRNSSYVGDFQFKINGSGFIDGIEANPTYYILVALSENSVNKATKWHYADAKNITGDGVGFDNLNRSFYSIDDGDSWVTGNYSFDIVCHYAHPDNDSLNWFVYLCNNYSTCWNSSVTVDVLGVFNNSLPNVQILSPGVGETISDLYNFSWDANDPDGDPLNFSGFLFNSDGSYNSTLFTGSYNYSFLWNSSSVSDGSLIFNVTAFDPYGNSSSAHSFQVDNIPDLDISFWVFDVLGSPVSGVSLTVRNASTNVSLWNDLSDASGFALYPSEVYEELSIYLDFPAYSAVLGNVSGGSVVHINNWVTGRVRLSNSLGAFLEDQDCSVAVYEHNSSILIHDYDTRCRAGPSFVNRHGDWVSIGNCSLTDSGGWYFFKGRVDESMGFEYDKTYDLVFTCNDQTANLSFTTSFEKTPLDMRKTEDFIRNYGGLFIVYIVFGFLCLLILIIIGFILFLILKP